MDAEKLVVVIAALRELEGDAQVPKHIKGQIVNTIKLLETSSELSVSRALSTLEDLTDDSNMQPFTRTQIFNIVSMLEAL